MPPRTSKNRTKSALRKPVLSPTKIGTFLECAIKYRYIYIDKIGRFYFHSSPELSFGSTLHRVLQRFHEMGGAPRAEDVMADLHARWIAAGYESAEQEQAHRAAAAEIVEAYCASYHQRIDPEAETIATEKTVSCDMGSFLLTGRIDRIDRYRDGTLEVIDYKSGRLETSVQEVADSLAMNCYQLILNKLYPDTPIRGTIYCLRTGVSASHRLTDTVLEEFEANIREIGRQIVGMDWDPVRPIEIAICAECDFLSRCQTYWRQHKRLKTDCNDVFSDAGL